METAIATALIAFLGSLMVAVLTYWFTKQREREAEWRKEKLAHYKAFIESFSGIIEGDSSPEGHKSFAKATNNLLLFAPQSVIAALNEFRHEIRVSNMKNTIVYLPLSCSRYVVTSAYGQRTNPALSSQFFGRQGRTKMQPNRARRSTSLPLVTGRCAIKPRTTG